MNKASAQELANRAAYGLASIVAPWVLYFSWQPLLRFSRAPLIDEELLLIFVDVSDILPHALLFAGLGILLGLGAVGQAADRVRSFAVIIALAMFCILLECAQLFNPVRHARISDLGANFLGGVFGLIGISGRFNIGCRLRAVWLCHWRSAMRCVACLLFSVGLYIVIRAHQGTNLSNWDTDMPLMLGNEATLDRPWEGMIRSVLLHDFAMCGDATQTLHENDHTFMVIGDRLNASHAIDVVTIGKDCRMLANGGVRLTGSGAMRSVDPPAVFVERVMQSNAFSIEIQCTPEENAQYGPARIVSLSTNPGNRNWTVGQSGDNLTVRIRTPLTGRNGLLPVAPWPGVLRKGVDVSLLVIYDNGEVRLNVDGVQQPEVLRLYDLNSYFGLPRGGGSIAMAILVFAPFGFVCGMGWNRPACEPLRWLIPFAGIASIVAVSLGLSIILSRIPDWNVCAIAPLACFVGWSTARALCNSN